MSNDAKGLSRRSTLKLVSAVSSLAAGLGAVFDGDDALADTVTEKFAKDAIGAFTIKLIRGKDATVVESIDLASFVEKVGKKGKFSIKFYHSPKKGAEVVLTHSFEVV